MYELTIFKSPFDNKTHRKMTLKTWSEFVELLRGLSKREGRKGGNNSSPLISPAVFKDGTTRANRNTEYWGSWCAIDIDDHDLPNDVEKLKEALHARFGEYNYVVYNTASSREDHLKFRLVFELDERIEHDRIKACWYAINQWVEELGDPQTKDMARMYYVPARYPSAFDFFFSNTGRAVNTSELIAKYPYREKKSIGILDNLSPEMYKAMLEYKKGKLNNTEYVWSGYKDCPFFPKPLGEKYKQICFSKSVGLYFTMYKIMVAIAMNAMNKSYPISSQQIADLCREFDREVSNQYQNRSLEKEAEKALEYAYRNI